MRTGIFIFQHLQLQPGVYGAAEPSLEVDGFHYSQIQIDCSPMASAGWS
ncbi:hypothetical protein I6F35_28315 [Bradyrhizobium sp. BRP22]|nr:hypothetical protein [Bradyrhizobium sp. BRP22]MCA1457076.1 hypothetical protein [Bradyrhizobium sp. BRP22]